MLHVLSGTSSRVAPALVILVHRAVLAHIPESTGAAQRSSLPVRAAPVLPGQVPLLQLVPDFVQVLKAALAAPDQDAQQLKVSLHHQAVYLHIAACILWRQWLLLDRTCSHFSATAASTWLPPLCLLTQIAAKHACMCAQPVCLHIAARVSKLQPQLQHLLWA